MTRQAKPAVSVMGAWCWVAILMSAYAISVIDRAALIGATLLTVGHRSLPHRQTGNRA